MDLVKFSKLSAESPPFFPNSYYIKLFDTSYNCSLDNIPDAVDKIDKTILNGSKNNNDVNTTEITSTSNDFDIKYMPVINKPTCNDVWKVRVINMKSFQYFYVQNTKTLKYIDLISSTLKFNKNDLIPLHKLPGVGTLVAAYYAPNNFWCRAIIQNKSYLGVFVSLIDFGNTEVLVKDIKHLPEEMKNIIPMAYQCNFRIETIETEHLLFNSDMCDLTNKYFNTNEMIVTFLNNVEPYSVTLSHNGVNIINILSKMVWEGIYPGLIDDPIDIAKYEMLNNMNSVSKYKVISVRPTVSMEHFYIETEQTQAISEKIKTKINNLKNLTCIPHPKKGDIVIARIDKNSKYFRARILLHYGANKYKCFLIDCGIFAICSEFFELVDNDLRTAPPVKIHCNLYTPKKIDKNLLKFVSLNFMNEIDMHGDDNFSKYMSIINVGSPCTIILEMGNLKIHQVIAPCLARVIDVGNLNSFKVRLDSEDARKLVDVLKSKRTYVPVTCPKTFHVYIANYNGEYKRVKYMGPTSPYLTSLHVYFMDDLFEYKYVDKLYEVPEVIKNIKISDIYCSLELNLHKYSTKKFIDLCNKGKTIFTIVITKNNSIPMRRVKLFLNSNDVTSMIRKRNR